MGLPSPKFGYNGDDIVELKGGGAQKLSEKVKTVKEEGRLIGFIGGPPCPDFSVAGKNKGQTGENGKLSGVYIDMICEHQPDFFLFENVKGLWRTTKHRIFYEELKAKLQRAGYKVSEKLINALEYGAPQERERIILLGFKNHTLEKLKYLGNPNSFVLDFDWSLGLGFKIEEIKSAPWPTTDKFSVNSILPSPIGLPIELTVEYWFKKNDVKNHPNRSKHFIPRAGLSKFLSIDEGDDKKKSYKRLHRWRYSPTAAYGNNEVHLHPYFARRLTVAEALAIQSMPREFVIPEDVTLTNMFKTIGNGVPYLVAKGLASTITKFLETKTSFFIQNDDRSNDRLKSRARYSTVTQEGQLSVFEPKE